MQNRFEALKVFCSLAETLQFKETANRLAVSPPVVSRLIAELENYLGESLFIRNTRQVKLTDFGQAFLPKAERLLADSEALFVPSRARMADEMTGVVRISVPHLPGETAVIEAVAKRLAAYPDLVLDWGKDTQRLNVVEHQIDLGVRIGTVQNNRFIVKVVGETQEKLIATPEFLAAHGTPKRWRDVSDFPLVAHIDRNTGRAENWYLGGDIQITPTKPAVITNDYQAVLPFVRAGLGIGFVLDGMCKADLQAGRLVELFADLPRPSWQIYVYRPQRLVTPLRVKVVFDVLVEVLKTHI
ncbi:LysR family transcriptional regulator [Conservatibacter flavescens]|uniref:LysR family transcriptional regulator n=1 Tax=Conservatibacter flavescens TaxID=28161 RepID=A0A2M8S5B8_9PAST|nr:LysR family transcriptional regulator [Conservatibacter flavescens]PJG86339.1 LysR family transcriptional regulator [Conservatibacter flavescens]